jgi:hypothetical protein
MDALPVDVRVRIPGEQHEALMATARRHGIPVPTLVAELVRRGLGGLAVTLPTPAEPPPRRVRKETTPELLNALVRLHEKGHDDNEIGALLDMSPNWVQQRRQRLRLPKNGTPGPRKTTTEEQAA